MLWSEKMRSEIWNVNDDNTKRTADFTYWKVVLLRKTEENVDGEVYSWWDATITGAICPVGGYDLDVGEGFLEDVERMVYVEIADLWRMLTTIETLAKKKKS